MTKCIWRRPSSKTAFVVVLALGLTILLQQALSNSVALTANLVSERFGSNTLFRAISSRAVSNEPESVHMTGTVVVRKVTDPPTPFEFFRFTSDAGDFVLYHGEERIFSDVVSGTFSVTETNTVAWRLSSATCSDGSEPDAIDLQAGEIVTCTFVNIENLGDLVIVQDTVPDDPTAVWYFELSGALMGEVEIQGDGHNTIPAVPGVYTIDENGPSQGGYDVSYHYSTTYSCTLPGGEPGPSGEGRTAENIEVIYGESTVCTFTNTLLPGSIEVTKTVGTSADGCATTTAITTTVNSTVYFCITIKNTSQVFLQAHWIDDPALGIREQISYELDPDESFSLKYVGDPEWAIDELAAIVTSDLVNTVIVTSSTPVSGDHGPFSETEPIMASTTGTATVYVVDLPNSIYLPTTRR